MIYVLFLGLVSVQHVSSSDSLGQICLRAEEGDRGRPRASKGEYNNIDERDSPSYDTAPRADLSDLGKVRLTGMSRRAAMRQSRMKDVCR